VTARWREHAPTYAVGSRKPGKPSRVEVREGEIKNNNRQDPSLLPLTPLFLGNLAHPVRIARKLHSKQPLKKRNNCRSACTIIPPALSAKRPHARLRSAKGATTMPTNRAGGISVRTVNAETTLTSSGLATSMNVTQAVPGHSRSREHRTLPISPAFLLCPLSCGQSREEPAVRPPEEGGRIAPSD
jgi:hypothetical protein